MRVTNDVLDELIENDGCRRGGVKPIHPIGIVRLALDLREARRQIVYLTSRLQTTAGLLSGVAERVLEVVNDQDRANKITRFDREKRTKSKKKKKS